MKTKMMTVIEMMKEAETAAEMLPDCFTVLSTEEKRALPKPRAGFEVQVDPLAEVMEQVNVALPGMSIDVIRQRLEERAFIRPLRNVLKKLLTRVDDTLHRKRALAWRVFATYYGTLNALAETNPKLAEDLLPLAEVFDYGTTRPKAAIVPKPAPPANEDADDDDDPIKAVTG